MSIFEQNEREEPTMGVFGPAIDILYDELLGGTDLASLLVVIPDAPAMPTVLRFDADGTTESRLLVDSLIWETLEESGAGHFLVVRETHATNGGTALLECRAASPLGEATTLLRPVRDPAGRIADLVPVDCVSTATADRPLQYAN
jgi:hypothetical protein